MARPGLETGDTTISVVMIGYDGILHRVELPIGETLPRNKGVRGGFAPAPAYTEGRPPAVDRLRRHAHVAGSHRRE